MAIRELTFEIESDFLGGDYTARCKDYPSLEGHGKTSADAVEDLKIAIETEDNAS